MTLNCIVPACGPGTRLHPVTRAVSEPLLPISDKAMVHYAISSCGCISATPLAATSYRTCLRDLAPRRS